MRANLKFFKSVGILKLNTAIKEYESLLVFTIEDYSDLSAPSTNYSLKNPSITIFVIEGIIDSIACYEELFYKDKNLLGITIEEFMDFTKEIPSEEVDELNFEHDDIPQFVYEFEKIGLQVWSKGKKGKIVTVIVNSKEHYFE